MAPTRRTSALIWALSLCSLAAAQYGFSVPEPDVADLDPVNMQTQYTVYNIVWLVNSTWQPTVDGEILFDSQDHISLWITSFNGDGYTNCLAPSLYSGAGGSWAWNITISDDDIDTYDGQFVYRLKPTVASCDVEYNTTEDEVPSRGFLVQKASGAAASSSASAAAPTQIIVVTSTTPIAASVDAVATTSASTASETSSSTVSTTTSSQTALATSTTNDTTANSSNSSGGLSTGTKVGIAVGCIGAAFLGIVASYLVWKTCKKPTTVTPPGMAQVRGAQQLPPTQHAYYYQHPPPGLHTNLNRSDAYPYYTMPEMQGGAYNLQSTHPGYGYGYGYGPPMGVELPVQKIQRQ